MKWLLFVTSLPTENATVRQRAWRALKASGAAVLRDGVYLLPEQGDGRTTLDGIAAEVRNGGGSAWLLAAEERQDSGFPPLFDRSTEYGAIQTEAARLLADASAATAREIARQARRLRKAFAALVEIDFFPGAARDQTAVALQDLELAVARALSPDEPQAAQSDIPRCDPQDFRRRVWATRRRPWVDRLASAWLIRRFIDTEARFLWLPSPSDCPDDAVGFDFDGATFSHVGSRVTFETLLVSFDLQTPALLRLGALVHSLDVGGVAPPESAGVESILAGLRSSSGDDDRLLAACLGVFDALHAAFSSQLAAPEAS